MNKKKYSLCFWTFDHIHAWHRFYLETAKQYGERLIVVVARDESVEKLKWKKPYYRLRERIDHVIEMKIADQVYAGKQSKFLDWLQEFQPCNVCLGYDQVWFSQGIESYIQKHSLDAVIIRIDSHQPEKYKSSKIKRQLWI